MEQQQDSARSRAAPERGAQIPAAYSAAPLRGACGKILRRGEPVKCISCVLSSICKSNGNGRNRHLGSECFKKIHTEDGRVGGHPNERAESLHCHPVYSKSD